MCGKGTHMEKLIAKIKEFFKMTAFICRKGLATMFGTY